MALLGVRVTTALAYVASVVLFAALLKRTAVARPVARSNRWGGLPDRQSRGHPDDVRARSRSCPRRAVGSRFWTPAHHGRAGGLSGALQPGSWLVPGSRWWRAFPVRPATGGMTLAVSALVPTIVVGLVFGNGGYQTFGMKQALMSFLVCLVVAGLCWRTPVVRWGALLSAGLVAGAYLVPTPVGTTATRLPELFAAPIIVAVAAVPLVAVIAAAAAVVLLLPPVSVTEVVQRGDPALSAKFLRAPPGPAGRSWGCRAH